MNFWQRLRFAVKAAPAARSVQVLSAMLGRGGGFGQLSAMRYPEAVASGYKGIVWVYRCVREIGQAVGSVPWKVYRRTGDDVLTPLPGHELEVLLSRPNPHTDRKQFFESWSAYLDLHGNAYWELVRVQGKPYHLFHIRPDWMRPVPDPNVYIKAFELDIGSGKKEQFEPSDIVHFKFLDPLNEYVGMSPITAAARTIATEHAAILWNKTIFDNSAVPNGILTVPAATMLQDDKDELKKSIEMEFTQENLHRPMVLWGGMTWEQMGLSHNDMSFLEQRRLNKYEICAALGVPPQIVGAQEDPTYSNYSVARLAFWEDLIIPRLDWLQNRINVALAPAFGPDIVVGYDISQVPAMREAFAQKVKTGEVLWRMGWPINAINRKLTLGFDDVTWGDTAWLPMNLVPAGAIAEQALPAPAQADPDAGQDEGTDIDRDDPYTNNPLDEGSPTEGAGRIPKGKR